MMGKVIHIPLFEYLFGLGQHLAKDWPYLFKTVKEDEPSSAGFNLVTASIGLRLQEMEKLASQLKDFDINKLEAALVESVRFVDGCLQPIVRIHQKKRPAIHHAELQIVALTASAFKFRYDVRKIQFAEHVDWKSKRKKFDIHLLMYYLYDLVRDYWRGTGDAKLHDTLSSERYLEQRPTQHQWDQVLDLWFQENQLKMRQRNPYIKVASLELLLLKYIYTHKLSVIQNTKPFHIEHLIPVAKLRNLLEQNEDSEDGLPINCVANLALLEQEINWEKGGNTFVQFLNEKLERNEMDRDEFEGKMKEMAERLLCPANIIPSEPLAEENYFEFLHNRFKVLKSEFLNVWQDRIPKGNL